MSNVIKIILVIINFISKWIIFLTSHAKLRLIHLQYWSVKSHAKLSKIYIHPQSAVGFPKRHGWFVRVVFETEKECCLRSYNPFSRELSTTRDHREDYCCQRHVFWNIASTMNCHLDSRDLCILLWSWTSSVCKNYFP